MFLVFCVCVYWRRTNFLFLSSTTWCTLSATDLIISLLLVINLGCILMLLWWVWDSSVLLLSISVLLVLQFSSTWSWFITAWSRVWRCCFSFALLFFHCACCLEWSEVLTFINCFTNIGGSFSNCTRMWPTAG